MLAGLMAPGIRSLQMEPKRVPYSGSFFPSTVKEERRDLHSPLPSQVGNGFLLDGLSEELELRIVELTPFANLFVAIPG